MNAKLLNLGCGGRPHVDWINVDFVSTGKGVIAHNLMSGLPFGDSQFDAVYHSHLLEHFPRDIAPAFIKECYRVLKPRGVLRVVVPDLESIVVNYLKCMEQAINGGENAGADYDWMMLEMFDQTVRNNVGGGMKEYLAQKHVSNWQFIEKRIGREIQEAIQQEKQNNAGGMRLVRSKLKSGLHALLRNIFGKYYEFYSVGRFRMSGEIHQWMYDRYSLSRLLQGAGFKDLQPKTAFASNIPNWDSYKLDLYNGAPRGESSLFIEAIKPNS